MLSLKYLLASLSIMRLRIPLHDSILYILDWLLSIFKVISLLILYGCMSPILSTYVNSDAIVMYGLSDALWLSVYYICTITPIIVLLRYISSRVSLLRSLRKVSELIQKKTEELADKSYDSLTTGNKYAFSKTFLKTVQYILAYAITSIECDFHIMAVECDKENKNNQISFLPISTMAVNLMVIIADGLYLIRGNNKVRRLQKILSVSFS